MYELMRGLCLFVLLLLLSTAALAQGGGSAVPTCAAGQYVRGPGLCGDPANPAGPQVISSVALSNSTFPAGSTNGTVVGNLSTVMTPAAPAFSGIYLLSGTDANSFQIVGNQIQVNAPPVVPVHVQSCSHDNNTSSSLTIVCTFGGGVAAGNTVVLFFGYQTSGGSVTVSSIADNLGDTCTQLDTQAPTGFGSVSAYCPTLTAGATTFTVTLVGSAQQFSVIAGDEFSGIGAVDVHGANYQAAPVSTSTDAITSGSVTTTANGDLIIGGTVVVTSPTSTSAGTGFTLGGSIATKVYAEYETQTTAGAVATTFTAGASTGGYQSSVIAFLPSAGGTLCLAGGCSYSINVAAQQAGISNSPFTQAFTITTAQAINSVSLSNNTFAPGASTGTTVGTISVTMSPASPSFAGTLALSGTDALKFQISSSTLKTSGTPCPTGPCSFSLNIVATQSGVSGSPFTLPVTITAGATTTNHKGLQTFNGQPQYYATAYVTAMVARWQAAGVAWARVPTLQPDLDPSCSNTLNFGALGSGVGVDALVTALHNAGIEPLLLVGQSAACASSTGVAGWVPPTSPSNWATNFAAKVAAHEGPLGHHNYEIWNEENGVWDWPPSVSAANYKTLLCAVYTAIHGADGSANVIVGGLSGTQGSTVLDTTYLTSLYSAGAHGCFDAIADHPYPDNGPTNNVLRGGSNNWDRMYFTTPSLQSIMAANADGSKKIWVTEIGCATAGQSLTNGYQITACPDQAHQAQMVTAAFNFSANGFPNLGPIFWWEDHDGGGGTCSATNPSFPLDYCGGLWDINLNAKSGVSALTNAAGLW